jgi:hypothetical protein
MPRNKLTKKRNKRIKRKTIQKGGAAAAASTRYVLEPQIEEINENTYNGEWSLPIMSKKYTKQFFSNSKQNNQTKEIIEKYFEPYKTDRHIMWSFHLMLQREHLYSNSDFVVFYHSYAESHVIFDVQTAIYELQNDLEPSLNRVILRLFKEPFIGFTIDKIKKDLITHGSNRNVRIRGLLISAACSLFANNGLDEIKFFAKGYSCGDLDYYLLLKNLLLQYNRNEEEVEELIIEILKSNYINQFIKSSYSKSKPLLHALKCTEYGDGQMLQIFINKSVLKEISYLSESLGIPSSAETDCALATNQVRILASPEYFMKPDPNLVRVYRYAANENIYKNRLEFISFLKNLIKKYIFKSIQ